MMRIGVRQRDRERGSAMLVTLILIAALLAGVAVLVSLQVTTTKSTELTRSGLAALHCAEAGLAASHIEVANNRGLVNTHLAAYAYAAPPSVAWQVQPAFLTTYFAAGSPNNRADLDGDGSIDFVVYIIDNDDEATNVYGSDLDSRVWLVSRCTKYGDTPKEVRELVEFLPSPTQYDWQEGRAFGNNNGNAFN